MNQKKIHLLYSFIENLSSGINKTRKDTEKNVDSFKL